ncbi:MAG TPA: hypothetical protein VL443_03345 [Cyclobacteriaceae bacterium]|jgi:hypothetical protein|nr:hypothetical protein [Cyclobacteriaceae bacterium]
MNVKIKDFNVDMILKNKGMELDICDGDNTHLGDMVINKAGIEWCKGKTHAGGGKKIKWKQFIEWCENNAD